MSFLSDIITIKPQRQIGDITAQATIEERHTDELTITDHPVEQGAQITDHAFKRPAEVVIRCGWSDSSTFLSSIDLLGSFSSVGANLEETYQQLLELQESRIPFDILTGKRQYSNMLIKSIAVTTDEKTENALFVTVSCREVILVQTQATTLPPKSDQKNAKKTGQTDQKGTKQLKPNAMPSPGGSSPPQSWDP